MQREVIMVCVTKQVTCERLINYGKVIKDKFNGELHIIHVAGEGDKFLGSIAENEALEYLFRISNRAGADITVLRSSNIEETIVRFANENNITHIVLGDNNSEEGILNKLMQSLQNCRFHVVPQREVIAG